MRTLARIVLDTATANPTIKNNSLGGMIASALEKAKPEAAYFTLCDGKRTAYLVLDLEQPSDMVPLFEPWFLEAGASIELTPVMTADDVRAGMERFAQAQG